jgi:penicillin-binding protein 1A
MKGLLQKKIPTRVVRSLLLALGALFCLALGISVAGLQYLSRDLPSLASIQSIEPARKTLVFAADGDTLHEFYRENRTLVPLARIPRSLQEAIIAIEDRRFYEHYGFDLKRFVKIVWVNLTSGSRPGASTLTQQLAKNVFLSPEKTVTRKIKELILALQIEATYTKDEILTMYLNQIFMGRDLYGMQAASWAYFGRNVWDLGAAETTMLAGMIQRPNHFSPVNNPEGTYERRSVVLDAMVASGSLSAGEADSLRAVEVTVVDPELQERNPEFAAYFVEEVRQELERKYGVEGLYSRGLRVTTTLVPRFQTWLEEAAEDHMVAEENLLADSVITRAEYDSLRALGGEFEHVPYLQCAGMLMDVRTGAILALMGGRSFQDYKFNIAMQAPRQPGSIFKPVVYLTALQHGYNPATILMDTPFVLDTGVSLWRPRNFSGRFEGPVSVRYALSRSINAPTAKLYLDFGLAPVIATARQLGFTADFPRVPALFLGAGEVKLIEVVAAYAAFANHGVYVNPYFVSRVETAEGEILEEAHIVQREVLDPALAWMMTSLLQTTLVEGTGKSARWRGFTKTGAGKTGTTNDETNAWFCGFTPSYCAGIWVGFDRPLPMGNRRTGARMALPIWARFMGKVADARGDEPFAEPTTIVHRDVCAQSGMLATASCDSIVPEVFLPFDYPQTVCDLHGGQIHDLDGFAKDFETLDKDDDDF